MSNPLNFQSIILKLQQYWAEQGCLIWQPYYSQVGAGTMNPATVLRVLGPEPWNVVYVEPSVRPDDGRYGENPNRFQMHYQLQVILKPDPGNPQELYLRSLDAIGIDPRRHDIRFVEDNWESPAIGAWGLGWEVWLDGQEITQFTYFQQSGGYTLDPVSVEITYGLERIAMPLQRVHNFKDMRWTDFITDGDLNYQAEYEHSKYYFELASVDRLRQMYDLFEAEAGAAIAAGLVLPAHDYILKCSHTFNVLDSRGAVGVTERQAMFARMRDLSHRVAGLYLEQRQRLEYPLLDEAKMDRSRSLWQPATPAGSPGQALPAAPVAQPGPSQDFLLEIGTEELPAADLESALEQLRQRLPAWLDDLRLPHGEVRILGTPRRLVAAVTALAARQEDRLSLVKGPPADRAFDSLGTPTRAAEGFARSKGIALADLRVAEMDGGRYAVAEVHEPGRPAVQVLSEALPTLAGGLRFDKSMRWNASGTAFSRPVRWLLALFGSEVVPFQFAGLQSGRTTRGLRHVEPAEISIREPGAYFAALQTQGILVDPAARRQATAGQVARLLAEAGASPNLDEDLLDEVSNLVEAPTAFRGALEQASMSLPAEVLISVMKKHQRYFPVQKDGVLLPYFIAVRNGDDRHLDVVTDGNEQVIRARFADAAFFITEDERQPLEAYLPRLDTLTFQKKLGSMLAKTRRIQRLVDLLLPAASLDPTEEAIARRAALLSKADLATHMVVEMTSLQGVMGAVYALRSGETPEVARAIREHYQPRSVKDSAPSTRPGLLLGLADRLDTLSGLFAAGLAPSGTRDPFAQRRAALGLVQALISWDLDFDLRGSLALAAEGLPFDATAESQAACLEFIAGRLRTLLLDAGYRYDVVDSVLAVQAANPAGTSRAVKELSRWTEEEGWQQILPAYARCVRITRSLDQVYELDPALLSDPAEKDLYALLQTAEAAPRRAGSVEDFLNAFLPLMPAVNRFFDAVLVMDEDPRLRRTRLALLQRISALAAGAADLSLLEGF